MKHWTTGEARVTPIVRIETSSELQMGSGKCTHQGCSCPSYVDPPGGFNCSRCGHPKSDHW